MRLASEIFKKIFKNIFHLFLKTRQDLLNAAGDIGAASSSIMKCLGEPDATELALQEILLTLAKAVATSTAALVLKAKHVAGSCGDTPSQHKIIDSAKETALSTSQLVACAKVLGPHIASPLCQDEMIEAAKLVATSVDGVSSSCHVSLFVCLFVYLLGPSNKPLTRS